MASPTCPACRKVPVNKEHTCPSCMARAYCSAPCLEAGKRFHRKECPKMALDLLWSSHELRSRVLKGLAEGGRPEEANRGYELVLKVAEMGLNYKPPPGSEAMVSRRGRRAACLVGGGSGGRRCRSIDRFIRSHTHSSNYYPIDRMATNQHPHLRSPHTPTPPFSPQKVYQYMTIVAHLLYDASLASRRLMRFEESDSRLNRGLDMYERFLRGPQMRT
jgi:hypothetical protein